MQHTTSVKQYSYMNAIEESEVKFNDSKLNFSREQIFATEQLMKNSYALDIAKKNPSSLKLAMYNVSAVGLSLNPQLGLAFLIPRRAKDGKSRIILDISYRGLIAIAVESGTIKWAKADLVYEQDQFTYMGPAQKPIHQCDPFSKNRGDVIGGYCIAELINGGFLVEAMSKFDMDKIRDGSEAFKKGYGPWVDWEDQMQLKCPVKRGSKWWPSSQRLATALTILNEENGEGLDLLKADNRKTISKTLQTDTDSGTKHFIQSLIERANRTGAFEACRELLENRIHNPTDLAYALRELDLLKSCKN